MPFLRQRSRASVDIEGLNCSGSPLIVWRECTLRGSTMLMVLRNIHLYDPFIPYCQLLDGLGRKIDVSLLSCSCPSEQLLRRKFFRQPIKRSVIDARNQD